MHRKKMRKSRYSKRLANSAGRRTKRTKPELVPGEVLDQAIVMCGCTLSAFIERATDVLPTADFDMDEALRQHKLFQAHMLAEYSPSPHLVEYAQMAIDQPCVRNYFKSAGSSRPSRGRALGAQA